MSDLAQRDNLTIRQLYFAIAGARGHRTILGTPEQIADQLEDWFVNNGADGFNIMPPWLPGGLDEFVDLVIPELQRRGLFRTEYEGEPCARTLAYLVRQTNLAKLPPQKLTPPLSKARRLGREHPKCVNLFFCSDGSLAFWTLGSKMLPLQIF